MLTQRKNWDRNMHEFMAVHGRRPKASEVNELMARSLDDFGWNWFCFWNDVALAYFMARQELEEWSKQGLG